MSFWQVTAAWALGHLGREQYASGRLTLARQTFQQALQWDTAGLALLGLGQIAYEWNDLPAAARFLEDALRVFPAAIQVDYRFETCLMLARVNKGSGMEQARLLTEQRPDLAAQWAAFRVQMALRQGDFSIGTRWFDALDLKNASPLERLTYIKMLLVRGEAEEALELLQNTDSADAFLYQLQVLLLQSETYHVFGETAQAVSILSRVLELTEPEGFVRLFLDAGQPLTDLLKGILLTRCPVSAAYAHKLLDALNNRDGSTAAPPAVSTQPLTDSLTERELEVLKLLTAGYSNQDIAQILVVSTGTVKTHIKNIYSKMSVHSRTQAAARARALGIMT